VAPHTTISVKALVELASQNKIAGKFRKRVHLKSYILDRFYIG